MKTSYPNITDSYIRSLTDKAITYAKGKDYYEKNFITALQESRDRHTFDAEVAGTDFYAVHLEFRGNKLAVCDCDCPAFSKYDGACKHIIATLFKVQELARADATHPKKESKKEQPKKEPQNITNKTTKDGNRKMSRYDGDNIEEVAARTMALFYLFDQSGSMSGTKIGQVNYAMKDIPKIIKDVADGAPNANIVIAAASFSNDVNWITPQPVSPDEFMNIWHDISAGGLTSLGAALRSLNEKMSRKAFLGDNPMGYLAPGIILLSDGEPTDDWETPLRELRKNNWFKAAVKVAFAVGEDANKDILGEVCGSKEAVVSIDDPEKIRQYIKFVTATVSKTGTTSSAGKDPQTAVNEAIANIDDNQPIVVDIPDIDDSQW